MDPKDPRSSADGGELEAERDTSGSAFLDLAEHGLDRLFELRIRPTVPVVGGAKYRSLAIASSLVMATCCQLGIRAHEVAAEVAALAIAPMAQAETTPPALELLAGVDSAGNFHFSTVERKKR